MYRMVEIENIHVDKEDNYRKNLDEDALRGLFKSYVSVHKRTNGERWMLNPVDVEKLEEPVDGKEYRLRFGFRRVAAAKYGLDKGPSKYAWMSKVPVNVISPENEEVGAALMMALIENLQREDVHVLDEAFAVQKALDETNVNQTQLGKELGKSKGWVSQRLSLLKMHDDVQAALRQGQIQFGHARQIGRLDDPEAQEKLLDLVDMNGWDVKETKYHVSKLLKGDHTPQTKFIADGTDVGDNSDNDGDSGKSESSSNKASGDDDSKSSKKTLGTVRPAKTLTEKVKDLSDRVQTAQKLAASADPKSRPKQEKRSAFYAGAQRGIAWALGQLDDVEYEDLFDEEGDE